MPKQEYLYNSEYVTIGHKVVGDKDLVVVVTDSGELNVARLSNLQKKEDSWYWKKAEGRKQELENITKSAKANLDKLADKLVDEALKKLASRMKFNIAFSENLGDSAGWALQISNELEKMVKEKAPEIIEERKH